MVSISPAAVIVLPLLLAGWWKREWALWITCVSIPFYRLWVFNLGGHWFNFPELAIILLGITQLKQWVDEGEITFPTTPPIYWLVGFLAVAALSVVYAFLVRPDVMVHPYSAQNLGNFSTTPYEFTAATIKQFAFRSFTVGSIILLVLAIDRDDIDTVARAVVYGAIATGGFGILFQISHMLNVTLWLEFVQWFGVYLPRVEFVGVNPIERMWTFAGEPGYTAHYLLVGLSIVTTIFVSETRSHIFERRTAGVLMCVLGVMLVLSTSTTGYGGALILGATLLVGAFIFPQLSTGRVGTLAGITVGSGVIAVIAIALLSGINIVQWIGLQASKLTFSAASGTIRLKHIMLSLEVASQRPLLGVGIGGQYGNSVLGTTLAETGIIGLAVFLGAFASLIRHLWIESARSYGPHGTQAVVFLVTVVTILLTTLVAKSVVALQFPWFWFTFALPTVLVWKFRQQTVSTSDADSGDQQRQKERPNRRIDRSG